jgi:hypothetical protein
VVVIAAIVLPAALLAGGLVGFFADPLYLPPEVLSVLDQRASVLSMFIGAAGLVVAVVALLLQLRAERTHSPAETSSLPDAGPETPPQASAEGERSIAVGGGGDSIASSGDRRDSMQMRAHASGQGRVYQAGGHQTINER